WEDAFDLAVCFGAFGHILRHEQHEFVRQIARSLRPSGRFVFFTAYCPPFWSPTYLWRRAFNAAMHIRNLLFAPPFIMYYLTFLLPGAQTLLESHGFDVAIHPVTFPKPWTEFKLVVATQRGN